jgi:hypothetical protein
VDDVETVQVFHRFGCLEEELEGLGFGEPDFGVLVIE